GPWRNDPKLPKIFLDVSTAAAQLRFAAEFAIFLAAGAGLSLALLRPALVVDHAPARALVAGGFVALAAAAFLHGSLVVTGDRDVTLLILRAAGVAAVVAGSRWWTAGPASRRGLWLGLGLLAMAV